MEMSQKLFRAAAQALYGPVYPSQVARDLGISRSSCVRYDLGERTVPAALMDRLATAAGQAAGEIGS